MKKKFFIFSLLSLFLITICSYSFATSNVMNTTRNAAMNTGNAIGNVAGSIVNGTENLVNGAATVGNNMTNANGDTENDATNTLATNDGMLGATNSDYTATRTATTGNASFLGMSDSTWTWLILGIVGIAIVALVWYYGAQYEHRNYNNN